MLLLLKELEQEGPVFSAKTLASVTTPPSLTGTNGGSIEDRALVREDDLDKSSFLDLVR